MASMEKRYIKMNFVFDTVISKAKVSSNKTYGSMLGIVKVHVYTRPAPYNDVSRIEVFDYDNNRIDLKTLNSFEQENLLQEANAEIKHRKNSIK